MRIAVIEPVPFGGLLHYAVQLADALAERGNDVDLIVARHNELARMQGSAHRRELLPEGAAAHSGDPTRVEVLRRRGRTAVRLSKTWTRIAWEVRRGGYDVVLLNGALDLTLTAAGAFAVTLAKGRTPVAHVCHNVRPFNRWGGSDLYVSSGPTMKLLARTYPRFDLLFVHGERSRAEYEQTWPPSRLAVIPHGDERVFSDEPPPPTSEPRILFFGAWRKMKGLPVLMEAFDRLSERRPEVQLTIAGPPVPEEGEAERVLEWARRHGERVDARPSYVPLEEVRGLFADARVVVLPYLTGYQSGVVHLAMTMERAVVATDVGDLASAVSDGETGRIVPSGDVEALARALEEVVSDPELAARRGAAGRVRVMTGSGWDVVAERVETELSALVGGIAG
ncbi:MAG TPA: glycosyltransferase family 4 protein [Conexibacter sp.]|nr:glycosyltransferase family 4 protein [Conexibacter sp.]